MVEKSTQSDFVRILPSLYDELRQGKLSTLQAYVVNVRGIRIKKNSDALSHCILERMCEAAPDGIKLQCGREYGFADANKTLRASDISTMTDLQMQGLPTNNLEAERSCSL